MQTYADAPLWRKAALTFTTVEHNYCNIRTVKRFRNLPIPAYLIQFTTLTGTTAGNSTITVAT